MTVEIVQRKREGGVHHDIYDIIRGGQFIIGSQTSGDAKERLERLEANNWKYLACYSRTGHQEPIEWINYVREKGWDFEFLHIEIGADGRTFFGGNIKQYSAAFDYLILDEDLANKVIALVPEAQLRKYDKNGNRAFDTLFSEAVQELSKEHPELNDADVAASLHGMLGASFEATAYDKVNYQWVRDGIEGEVEKLQSTSGMRM